MGRNKQISKYSVISSKALLYNRLMKPFIILNPRNRLISLLVINIFLLVTSVLLLTQSQIRSSRSASLGWLVVCLLLISIPWFIWQILDTRPYLVVDEHGLRYRPFGLDFIPWNAIKDITLKSILGTKVIYLELEPLELWLAKLPTPFYLVARLNQVMGFPIFNLNLSRIGVNMNEVFDRITEIRAYWQE